MYVTIRYRVKVHYGDPMKIAQSIAEHPPLGCASGGSGGFFNWEISQKGKVVSIEGSGGRII